MIERDISIIFFFFGGGESNILLPILHIFKGKISNPSLYLRGYGPRKSRYRSDVMYYVSRVPGRAIIVGERWTFVCAVVFGRSMYCYRYRSPPIGDRVNAERIELPLLVYTHKQTTQVDRCRNQRYSYEEGIAAAMTHQQYLIKVFWGPRLDIIMGPLSTILSSPVYPYPSIGLGYHPSRRM